MARVRFRAMLVTDARTGLPRLDLAGLTGTIVVAGTTTPASITDNDGLPIDGSSVTISPSGFTPTFWSEDGLTEVDWLAAGAIRVPIDSTQGLEEAAAASAEAAALSAAAAQDAADHVTATSAGVPAGGDTGQTLVKVSAAPGDVAWGDAGTKWTSGDGTPAGPDGAVGTFYLDRVSGLAYEKTDVATWTQRANLKGPAGAPGAPGAPGAASTVPGPPGPAGGSSLYTIYWDATVGTSGGWVGPAGEAIPSTAPAGTKAVLIFSPWAYTGVRWTGVTYRTLGEVAP